MKIIIEFKEKNKGYFIKNTPESIKQADETYKLISKINIKEVKKNWFKKTFGL